MTKKVRIVTYVDKEIYDILKKKADMDKRSLSNFIEIILINFVKK